MNSLAKQSPSLLRMTLPGGSSGEEGNSIVEFALCVMIVLASIFGVIYFSMALYADHFVADAAKGAARYAMVRGSTWSNTACATTSSTECVATSTDVKNFVEGTIPPGLSLSNLTVTTTWPGVDATAEACDTVNGSNSPSCVVKVDVSYSFSFPLPFARQNAINLQSSSTLPISE
jgi:Flp pilus assembly protein TadG